MRRGLELLGRAAMAAVFVRSGWETFRQPGERRVHLAATIGLPQPEAMVRFNGAAMLVGGSAFAAGIFPRAAAAGLVASLAVTTYAGHRFWEEEDPATRSMQRTHFLKNLAIVGGLLVYLARSGGE